MCDHINCLSSGSETDGQRRCFVGVTCGRFKISSLFSSVPTTHLQEQPHPLIQQPHPNPHSVTALTAWMEEPMSEATVSALQGTVECTVKWPSTHPLVRLGRVQVYMHGWCSEQCCRVCTYSPSPPFLYSISSLPSLLPHPLSPHSPLTPPFLLHPLAWQTWSIPVENATMALVTMHWKPVSAILSMKGSAVTLSQVSDTCGLTGTAWYSVMWQEVHVGVYRLLQCAYRLLTTWPCLDMPSLNTAIYVHSQWIYPLAQAAMNSSSFHAQ